jgi:hypothetical protein
VKDCGVAVTISQGAELTASCFEWIPVNVGTIPFRPSPVVANGFRWIGTSSAVGTRVGRRGRSSPRAGKQSTWRRTPVDIAERNCNGRRHL